MNLAQSFYQLTPDVVLEGIESAGYQVTGEYVQLNSYENRVFDIFLETTSQDFETLNGRVIAKFYRPNRWSREALFEEHFFEEELASQGQPIISPLTLKKGQSLGSYNGLLFALFPKCMGRMPQELSLDELKSVGRLIARMHNVGEQSQFQHRPRLTPEDLGWPALDHVESFVAPEVWLRYENAASDILEWLEENLDPETFIRVHGDCHKGNLLQKFSPDGSNEFFFVDFDDTLMGPAAQDFWMLFSGDQETSQEEKDAILSGYEDLRMFPDSQLKLFEGLRGLRIIHYAGWIARRWEDPTFPYLFPQYKDYTYWAEEVEALERIAWSL